MQALLCYFYKRLAFYNLKPGSESFNGSLLGHPRAH